MYKPIARTTLGICTLAFLLAQGEPGVAQAAGKVQVISAGAMSKEDAEVLAGERGAIASAAELNGYDLGSGSWIQNQVICPDAHRHVIMHYLKISPDGAISLFTAAVPRLRGTSQQLRVRIVPVLYHGAPAFHVFGSSPSQRELINEVISTDSLSTPAGTNDEWKNLAFCYAALAGAEPATKSVTAPEEITPTLEVGADKKVREMRFSVLGPDHLLQDWRIVFDRNAHVKEIFLTSKPMRKPEQVPPHRADSELHTAPAQDTPDTKAGQAAPQQAPASPPEPAGSVPQDTPGPSANPPVQQPDAQPAQQLQSTPAQQPGAKPAEPAQQPDSKPAQPAQQQTPDAKPAPPQSAPQSKPAQKQVPPEPEHRKLRPVPDPKRPEPKPVPPAR